MVLNKRNPEALETIATIIKDGGVAILPCDTIYGLCAVYGIGEKPLMDLKGRDNNKPFLVLATIDQAKEICTEIPDEISTRWPAPLTAILRNRLGGTTAVRVPADPFLQELLAKVGKPIYSTSVNMAGEPSLLNFSDICCRFEALVDILVKGEEVQGTVPSTLIDATTKPFRLIRQGSYDVSDLL